MLAFTDDAIFEDQLAKEMPSDTPQPNWPIMLMSAPADSASMKALVPDFAIVPRLLIMSALVMPMPESMMVSVFASTSGMILMKSSDWPSSLEASVRDSYLILSRASEELETSSLRKISLLL